MNAGLIAVIAAQAEARRSLLERFRVSDATHVSRARTLNEMGIVRTSALDEMLRKGAVREASPGAFYLDEPTVAALERAGPLQSRQSRKALVAVLVILLIIPIVFLVVMRAVN